MPPFNLQNKISQGISSMLNPSWNKPTATTTVPTADQMQKAKIVASTNVNNSNIPKVIQTPVTNPVNTGNSQNTNPVPQSNPFQTGAISSALNTPSTSSTPLNSYDTARQNAYDANAPIDLNKLAPYSQQIEEANKSVADITNAQRDAQRQAMGGGVKTGNQLNADLNANAEWFNPKLADATTNQTAANQTLATQLALQQAQRTGRVEQANIPFSTQTPVSVSPGNSLINPYSGATVATGGITPNISDIASQIVSGKITQDDANKLIAYNPTLASQLNTEIYKQNPNFSRIAQEAGIGADTSSLQGQQQLSDTNKTVLGTVTQNGQNILNLMGKTGISDTGVPAITAITRGISNRVLTNNDMAAFNESLNTLRSNYAQINAKGGSVTQDNKDAASSAIPDNISIGGLKAILEQMWNGANTNLDESQKTIESIKGRLGGNNQNSASYQVGQINKSGDLKWDGKQWIKA